MVRPRPEAEGPGDTRILRNTFVPVWSVPPRVLLVEDDEVCRTLASRLLHVRQQLGVQRHGDIGVLLNAPRDVAPPRERLPSAGVWMPD